MRESGTWIFTSDQYHVRENYEDSHPQGWLARDHDDWVRSHQMIQMLARRTEAKVILGHDKEVFFLSLILFVFDGFFADFVIATYAVSIA